MCGIIGVSLTTLKAVETL